MFVRGLTYHYLQIGLHFYLFFFYLFFQYSTFSRAGERATAIALSKYKHIYSVHTSTSSSHLGFAAFFIHETPLS